MIRSHLRVHESACDAGLPRGPGREPGRPCGARRFATRAVAITTSNGRLATTQGASSVLHQGNRRTFWKALLTPRVHGPGESKTTVRRILIASGVARVRKQWSLQLEQDFSVHEVVKRRVLQWSVATLRPDVLLLDVTDARPMIVAELRALSPETQSVLFSPAPNDDEALAALKAGARGYAGLDSDPVLIRRAVEKVLGGEIWVARRVVPRLLQEIHSLSEAPPQNVLSRLSCREQDTAKLLLLGESNRNIAEKLGITEATVKAHLTAIYRKCGVPDRLHLALLLSHGERNCPS
jgi:two-component system, NarL family, nitrate/nitrite response regulator NarL